MPDRSVLVHGDRLSQEPACRCQFYMFNFSSAQLSQSDLLDVLFWTIEWIGLFSGQGPDARSMVIGIYFLVSLKLVNL